MHASSYAQKPTAFGGKDGGPRAHPGKQHLERGKKMMEFDEDLTEKAKSDLLYLEQLNSYAENTKNTPEYIRAMAMYTQALHVIEERYGNLEHHIYRSK
ncbi:hypothetical protein B6U90_04610 [Thermoplasmatales archaeon ex4484_6]|nr:MAG: hypothetical protein B6U90_04610 [Thermoplasmatales archaeon ex4484_6]RLF66050.1 MAG: hypothetical protein DRN57_07865 [Thermoplasmata archaeon]